MSNKFTVTDKPIVSGCIIPKTVIKPQTISSPNKFVSTKNNLFPDILSRTCPSCHGLGHTSPMMMVNLPGSKDDYFNPHPNKKPSSDFYTCKQCKGTGKVSQDDSVKFF